MAGEDAVREKLEKGYMRAHAVIEIVGSPKEHVEDTLRLVLKKLREEKGVDIVGGKVHEPRAQGAFFSTFAELDILIRDFSTLAGVCFNYLPSSVEVLEPSSFKLAPAELAGLFNDLLGRLHEMDLRLKNTNAANILLDGNLGNLLKNFVLMLLGSGSRTLGDLSKAVGIAEQPLEPFLARFASEGLIRKEGHHYTSVVKR
ncbi:TPA: hypothetical protein HA231_00380 [Candidatus Woesearchaeota archaeon]|nr:hypothetical protein [Candidatus Woesearchaeota archaeon]